MSRYIIADPASGNGWGHIFSIHDADQNPVERERVCRFVFDTEAEKLIHLDVDLGGDATTNLCMADDDEIADVEDSLKHGNEDALRDPGAYGLLASDDLPSWYDGATPPATGMR